METGSVARPKNFGRITEMTAEDLGGFDLEAVKCRSCSGYGNCGYKRMGLIDRKPVSICQMRIKKLQCERDGVEFEMGGENDMGYTKGA